jgi:hypothetical protein
MEASEQGPPEKQGSTLCPSHFSAHLDLHFFYNCHFVIIVVSLLLIQHQPTAALALALWWPSSSQPITVASMNNMIIEEVMTSSCHS